MDLRLDETKPCLQEAELRYWASASGFPKTESHQRYSVLAHCKKSRPIELCSFVAKNYTGAHTNDNQLAKFYRTMSNSVYTGFARRIRV